VNVIKDESHTGSVMRVVYEVTQLFTHQPRGKASLPGLHLSPTFSLPSDATSGTVFKSARDGWLGVWDSSPDGGISRRGRKERLIKALGPVCVRLCYKGWDPLRGPLRFCYY
jgi:hypothetical protein